MIAHSALAIFVNTMDSPTESIIVTDSRNRIYWNEGILESAYHRNIFLIRNLATLHNTFTDTDKQSMAIRGTIDKLRQQLSTVNNGAVDPDIMFAAFLDVTFERNTTADPIARKKFNELYWDWLRVQYDAKWLFSLKQAAEHMKKYCGGDSTLDVFYNVRIKPKL